MLAHLLPTHMYVLGSIYISNSFIPTHHSPLSLLLLLCMLIYETQASVAQRLVQIGRQEGLLIEGNAAELLVEQMGNDIRQCINAAQVGDSRGAVGSSGAIVRGDDRWHVMMGHR